MDQSDLDTEALPVDATGELYRLIAETIPQMVWSTLADGTDDFHNSRASEYSGLDAAQLAGNGWQAMVHPDDLPGCLEAWRKAFAKGESFSFEYRLRRRDGAWRWHLGRALPLRDRRGRISRWFGTATDIDDQKRAAERLQAQVREHTEEALRSERRFRALTELSSDWYWEQDAELRFVGTGGRTEQRAGISVAEHIGKRRWELRGTEILGQTWDQHRALLAARAPFYDLMLKRTDTDGSEYYVSVSGEPRFDASGTFTGYQGIAKDVTARYRAEAALRESEARFRSLTSLSSDFYWETDARHCFSLLDYGARHFPLFPREHLIGKARWEIPSTAPGDKGWREHRALLDAHQPFRDFEFARARPDGVTFYYTVSGEPMFDTAGGFIGYRGVGREIGDRKRAELALRQSSEKYEGLVDSIDGIVWEADPDTFQFLFVSSQAERLLGYPAREWLEDPDFWRNHTHPDDIAWATDYCRTATAEKRNHEFEYRMIAADGRTVWLRDLVTVVVERGAAVKLRGIMVDVTGRRTAEHGLRKSEERFRALTGLSSDFYWETDSAHRFVMMEYGKSFRGPMQISGYKGKALWDVESIAPDEEGWRRHRATVDAHLPFHDFEFSRARQDNAVLHYSVSGEPVFDAAGTFQGYRGVGRDVTERRRNDRALRDGERRIRALLRRLTATQEAERRRIAADLHDFVGQNLTALGVSLETLRAATAEAREIPNVPTFDEMSGLLRDTMDSVRQVMSDLRPPLLDDYGLVAALESHARHFASRTGLAVSVEGERIGARPAPNVELALFRIAQEALANALKHAGATSAKIVLASRPGFLRLSIEDNGTGFAQPSGARAEHRGGWGLPMMRERAEEAGGTLKIEFPARGTRVVSEVPHVDSNHPG